MTRYRANPRGLPIGPSANGCDAPPWGTRDALLWGVAHPDWPFHERRTRREYCYPSGRWWNRLPSRAFDLSLPGSRAP